MVCRYPGMPPNAENLGAAPTKDLLVFQDVEKLPEVELSKSDLKYPAAFLNGLDGLWGLSSGILMHFSATYRAAYGFRRFFAS